MPEFIDHEIIVLNKNGVWLTNGEEITHTETCRAFAKHLFRDAEGYYLKIGNNHKRIEVEDTPYFVTRIERDLQNPSQGPISLILNDESTERLDPRTLQYQPSRLTCEVEKHGIVFEAKFLSQPYFELLQDLEQEGDDYFVTIESRKIKLQNGT